MKSLADLLKEKPENKRSERAELIKYFVDNLYDKKGNHFNPRMVAIKLSHLKLPDLYYMVSVAKDIKNRSGVEAMNKWFWWSLKVIPS